MPLPNIFAAQTTPQMSELDQNFNALGVLVPIPGALAGTNTLTFTPTTTNVPTVTAYSNYAQFCGVVVTSNTGPVTLQVGSLGALPVYKDTGVGPAALSGGELVTACAATFQYDSALNSGGGGFHAYTNTAFAGGTISGNLVIGGNLNVGSLASVTKFQVGASASSVTRLISALASVTLTSIVPNSSQDVSFALAGAQVGDSVALGLPAAPPAGAGFVGFMAAAGTVTLRVINPAATVTIGAATITVRATAMGFT